MMRECARERSMVEVVSDEGGSSSSGKVLRM